MPQFLISFFIITVFLALMGCVWFLVVRGLATYKRAAYAVLRRNFVSYFSNPTGYLFICVFVLFGSFAAFWPNDFFNSNLANLDQLNRILPLVMLVFIPAVTMSIWADERRQGTDELLLTIPAADFDIVLGKYLSAVAIFTVALMFSLFSNFFVLGVLGNPDVGLFLATYAGYWFMGLGMLAIGMVASFLTGNLTVGFILGALFNVPLAFASSAEVIFATSEWANRVRNWSMAERFVDFGRGVISPSSVLYFVLIAVATFYVSIVLIGRRHWLGGRDAGAYFWHYLVRTVSIVVLAVGLIVIAQRFDILRADVTQERLTALATSTRTLLRELDRPVRIDAFISPSVPETYVQTRLELLGKLREFEALGGDKVDVHVYDTERFGQNAELAKERYGIESQQVVSEQRGAVNLDEIYLGVAFTSGLEKVKVPFFDRGLPIEYELIRSIATVAEQKRKRLGVLMTDAPLFGSFNQNTFSMTSNEPIIGELEKQYDVVRVSADQPVPNDIDVLLAVQPSSLPPDGLNHLIAAIRSGTPTALFEDPMPQNPAIPATSAPRMPPGGMGMFAAQQQMPQPKGNINELWDLLGVDFPDKDIVWQNYNPYRRVPEIPPEIVFVDHSQPGNETPFSETDVITSGDAGKPGLQQLVFLWSGAIRQRSSSDLSFDKLVTTGNITGVVGYDSIAPRGPFADPNQEEDSRPTKEVYTLAAHIRGKAKPQAVPMQADNADEPAAGDSASGESESASAAPGDAAAKKPDRDMNVVLVADSDAIGAMFFQLRSQGNQPGSQVNFNFDNVTFVLNVLDSLAGDDRFIEVRKRRAAYRTLEKIEERTATFLEEVVAKRKEFTAEFSRQRDEEQKKLDDAVEKIRNDESRDLGTRQSLAYAAQQAGSKRLTARFEELERQRDEQIEQSERKAQLEINKIQNQYKLLAVSMPPIPPLVVGLIVFFNRRAREREGVARSRLRMT